jgi:hypothetical protein
MARFAVFSATEFRGVYSYSALGALSRQIELTLFYDARLDIAAMA